MIAQTLKELKALDDEELLKLHDRVAKNTQVGVGYYLEELRARQLARYTRRLDRLTIGIFIMTAVVTIATLLNLLIVFVSFSASQ